MNIWVIGRSYPQMKNNMQGSFEFEQAKMLAKYGNNVSYIACVFHPFKKVRRWGFCNWKEDGVNVFIYSQFYTFERMKLHFGAFKSRVWNKFLTRVETHTSIPDIIHIHYPASITIAKDLLKYQEKGTRIICTEHWSQVLNKTLDAYEKKQLELYVNKADRFLCVSTPLKQAILDLTNTNKDIYIVPNIVNSIFTPRIQKKDNFDFIAVGTLIPLKQFDRVVRAFAKQFKGKYDVKLTIVGDGVEFSRLKKLVEKLCVEEQITFTGKLNRVQTAEKMANSDVLICYSRKETFGVPIIEAWSCGLPVITTTGIAVREGWDNRLGIQISPDSDEELAKKMQFIYEHRYEYDRKFINNYATKNYSEDTVYNVLQKHYLACK